MTYLRLLAAGDTVYVFDDGDNRIDAQELVCIGANLDTERFNVPADKWDGARSRLDDDVEIVDCRRGHSMEGITNA